MRCCFVGHSRKGCRRGHPIPRGWPPELDFLVLEGTLVLLVRRTFARTACERASGDLVSRLGRKIFGPTRQTGSRQEGVQETIESASCVAARKAGSGSPTGTTGALEASAGHSETLHGVSGISVSCRSRPARFHRGWQRKDAKSSDRVRSSRSRCARVPRQVAEVDRRRSVRKAAPGCGWGSRTEPSPQVVARLPTGESAFVTRFSVESAIEGRRRARGGSRYRWKVSRIVKAEARHVGRRRKRSWPKAGCEGRTS